MNSCKNLEHCYSKSNQHFIKTAIPNACSAYSNITQIYKNKGIFATQMKVSAVGKCQYRQLSVYVATYMYAYMEI